MAQKIPENVVRFIFEHIDSVEQLEILLFMRSHEERGWNSEELSKEFRSNLNSVSARLSQLQESGLVQISTTEPKLFRFEPENSNLTQAVTDLAECYRVRKQSILELIFSPLKKGRDFAQAFNVRPSGKKGDENG